MPFSRTELLAPAKDKETAFAAIDCGADAIYIGAPRFGARKNVPNTLEDIKEVIDYAHKYWAKVFITMNTILTDSELKDAVQLAIKLDELGADALIIQDMGLLESLIELELSIPIHMSTQCDNYLPEKVKFFNDIGVSRVILARELSIEQIEKIHRENPDLELESFVHGALCVSMSGQCYLSQAIGERSANRGECAQPCRKKYSVLTAEGKIIKKDFYALCLKDFNASNYLIELKNAGIVSFKIEGRLKDITYVKNVVAYYRERMGKGSSSGKSFYSFIPNPEKSFNRGFTSYFLKGRTDCFNQESPKSKGEYLGEVINIGKNWIKVKTDKSIHQQDGIYFNGDGFKVNKAFENIIYPNKKFKFKVGDKLWRNYDSTFEKELLKPVKRQIEVSLFVDNDSLILIDEDNIKVTMTLPSSEKSKNPEKMKETFIKQFSKTGDSDFYIRDFEINTEIAFMPVSVINQLRRDLFDKLMNKRIEYYNNNRQKQSKMTHSKYYQNTLDYRANIHNKKAKEFYEKCGVTEILEPSFETKRPQRQVELMRCKHCIKYALNLCKSKTHLVLQDEFGKIYPLKFDCNNCEMSLIN